jgi:Protein of unknown function (DUF2934)
MMNRISLIDFAKKQAMEPLLEKEVQVRAYELYELHGKRQGFALQDWLEAEDEVMDRFFNHLPLVAGLGALGVLDDHADISPRPRKSGCPPLLLPRLGER